MEGNQLELRVFMLQHNLKSKDVAECLGRSNVTVRRYMCGTRKISDELLNELKRQTLVRLQSDVRQTTV